MKINILIKIKLTKHKNIKTNENKHKPTTTTINKD